ncbi:EpsG family protein [uncultured Chryseobacterium sp.]|uniref:EpsG family protein n=1 Tax=uncultured Chryseobacterium sp. TaxID=259322 RepID=UPI0025DCBDF9|nr:EpsG family protein [uncultured Chryseobacterium sp.]
MIYVVLLILFAILSIMAVIDNRRKKYYYIISLSLILLASLRDGVGTDWKSYYNFYIYGASDIEVGYATLNNFFSAQGFSFNFFLLIVNVLSIFLISRGTLKLSAIPAISLMIYFSDLYLYFNFSGMRQAIALSFSIYSLTFCIGKKRNIYLFLIVLLCAISFHISAIVFAIAYFVPQRSLNKKEIIFLIIGFTFFSSLVFFASSFLTGLFASKAEYYLEIEQQSSDIKSLFIIGIFRRLIPLVVLFIFSKKYIFKDSTSVYLFNLYLIGLGIYLTTYLISPDVGVRLSVYFTVLEMFLLANLVFFAKKFQIKVILLLIIFSLCSYKLSTYFKYPAYEYKSIIEGM